ncbi:MAG: hemerythrin domain-containing protein [Bdellovibrionales bacterium]|nr:hemerythrin domain-containing protein [Bdellovibrionales bacterium]
MTKKKTTKKTTTMKTQIKNLKTQSSRTIQAGFEQAKDMATSVRDNVSSFLTGTPATHIVDAIKRDHDDLKDLIKVLKDRDQSLSKRKTAFADFSALLKSHSVAEEKAVYSVTDFGNGKDLTLDTAEGVVEHHMADILLEEIDGITDNDTWTANVKVLAEMVDHHIKEEESELLQEIKKNVDPVVCEQMLHDFIQWRAATQERTRKQNSGVLDQVYNH